MVTTADEQRTAGGLLLEVALQAERLIALRQHPLVHRTVRLVTGKAAFPQRLVLEDKAPLGGMTLETGLVRTH